MDKVLFAQNSKQGLHVFKHLHLVLVIWALAISSVQAKSYIRDYTYKASDADSKITSRTNALDQVKLILLQEIGTHIRQEINITKDGSGNSYASEDVEAITAGLTRVDIIEEKWNGETYYLKAKIDADTESVLKALAEIKNEKSEENLKQLAALKENQRKLHEARDELKKLRKLIAHANTQEKEKLVIKYVKQVDQVSLSEMLTKGYNFSQNGQHEDALYWYRKAAEKGNSNAQYELAIYYEKGRVVKQDYAKAIYWYQLSADQGNANGEKGMGFVFQTGRGVKKDYKQAVYWYRKAAKNGDAEGQFLLARLYRKGKGVEKDFEKALYWLRKSANQGNRLGQNGLGVSYRKGEGVKQSYEQAANWYHKAAEQGHPGAQKTLGELYANGNGVEQDYEKALYWSRKSAEKGFRSAQYNVGFIFSRGLGVKQDMLIANKWFKKACEKNYKKACLESGLSD
jgi:uncharacterized protein